MKPRKISDYLPNAGLPKKRKSFVVKVNAKLAEDFSRCIKSMGGVTVQDVVEACMKQFLNEAREVRKKA